MFKSLNRRVSAPIAITIIIVVAVAFIGGIMAYQYWWTPKEEKKPSDEIVKGIIVSTDKTEYERLGENIPVIFTIKNNTDREIFSTWTGAATTFNVIFESYNEEKKTWEVARYFYFFSEPSLNPGESVQFETELFTQVPIGDTQKKLRIKTEYLDHENCKYPDYMENEEVRTFCYNQFKTVYSNEFVVKGPLEEVYNFCYQEKEKLSAYFYPSIVFAAAAAPTEGNYVGPYFYLNFDNDKDKEIVGVCVPDSWGGYRILFVLDKQNGDYKPVLVMYNKVEVQRYYKFANLGIKNIDQDGIDEIIFYESGWYGGGGDGYLHLYSPKYKEWFWLKDWWEMDIESGKIEKGREFSANLNLTQYKVFKEFLSVQPFLVREPE